MYNSRSWDWNVLVLADHVELVNKVLVDKAERLSCQKFERFDKVLCRQVLRDARLTYIYWIGLEIVGLYQILLLTNFKEIVHLAPWMYLAVPKLHARQHIAVIRVGQLVRVTLACSQKHRVHLTNEICICHWKLTFLIQFQLMSLCYVLCNCGSPLVLDSNLALLITKVIVAPKQLDALFPNAWETFFDNFKSIWGQAFQFVSLDFGLLKGILTVPLKEHIKLVLTILAFELHAI